MTPLRAVAKDCKVVIQRCCAINAQTVHHREAGTIDNRKILVAPGMPDLPRSFQIG
jgi:hypothetical protein